MEKEQDDEEIKKAQIKKANITSIQYKKDEELRRSKSHTSFGKLILAKEPSFPTYSIGKAHRFGGNSGIESLPGPLYAPTDETIYKYKKAPKWIIGNSFRGQLANGEEFDWFRYKYAEKYDFSKLPKKWNNIVGGAIALDTRIKNDIHERVPGPGRYEPNYNLTKPKDHSYIIGEKTNSSLALKLLTGTGTVVGPGKYDIEKVANTSIHHNFPKWTLGSEKRKSICNRTFSMNETYCYYSSVGEQIITNKKSEPQIHMGKSTRTKEQNRGMFLHHMERCPTRICIKHPDF